jgi:hypothetical protein
MGFFDKLVGGGKEYPPLESSSPVYERLNQVRGQLESLSKQVSDPLEVVPSNGTVFVFIGKPPKTFGIVWIRDGAVHNFKTLAAEKNIPQSKFQVLSDKLRESYSRNADAERYSALILNRKVTVTPSAALGKEVNEIISEIGG